MAKRGPQRTPTAVLERRGSWLPGARTAEPRPDPALPDCPPWLSPAAVAVWQALAPQLHALGILAEIDQNALARYCHTFARWRTCAEFLARHGNVFPVKDKSGRITEFRTHPEAALSLKLSDQLNRLESQFGLSPSARASLSVQKPDDVSDDHQRFFGVSRA